MTHSNQERAFPWRPVVAALCAAIVALWWFQRQGARKVEAEGLRLRQENLAMRQELARLRSDATAEPVAALGNPESVPAANAVAVAAQAPEVSPQPSATVTVMTPTGEALPPRADGLMLAGTHAAPVPNGLQATLRFTATVDEPLGIVALVVRLPRNAEGRIVEFGPKGEEAFTEVAQRVSDDGKFAVFHGTAGRVRSLEFALTVSGPVTASVTGTCGVGPYQLAIGPGGAQVQEKK